MERYHAALNEKTKVYKIEEKIHTHTLIMILPFGPWISSHSLTLCFPLSLIKEATCWRWYKEGAEGNNQVGKILAWKIGPWPWLLSLLRGLGQITSAVGPRFLLPVLTFYGSKLQWKRMGEELARQAEVVLCREGALPKLETRLHIIKRQKSESAFFQLKYLSTVIISVWKCTWVRLILLPTKSSNLVK